MRNLSAIAGIGNKFKRRINKHLIIIQHLSNAALWRIAFAPYRKYLIRNTLVQAHSDSAPLQFSLKPKDYISTKNYDLYNLT